MYVVGCENTFCFSFIDGYPDWQTGCGDWLDSDVRLTRQIESSVATQSLEIGLEERLVAKEVLA